MNLRKNISFLMYTAEPYLPIAELSIDEFNKFSKDLDIKKYVVCNSAPEEYSLCDKNFQLINTKIEFKENASHFSEVMRKGLSQLDTEYVLFFLDDYFLINEFKTKQFKKLLKIIKKEKIDHFSLMSYSYEDWETLKINYKKYSIPENLIIKLKNSFLYQYSLQPSIWKVSSLIEMLEYNPLLTTKQMDITNIRNKRGDIRLNHNNAFWNQNEDFWDYNFSSYCFKRTPITSYFAFDLHNGVDDYLITQYAETIVGGKFNFNTHRNNREYLIKFLEEKKINSNNPKYKKFFNEN